MVEGIYLLLKILLYRVVPRLIILSLYHCRDSSFEHIDQLVYLLLENGPRSRIKFKGNRTMTDPEILDIAPIIGSRFRNSLFIDK